MKHKSIPAAAALLLALTLGGCSLFPAEEEALAPPLKSPAAVSYTTTTAERGTIVDSVSVSGSFISTTSYDLSFEKRSGYLSELFVKQGDMVEKGQLLARLDTDALELDIKKQRLVAERAKIALDMAKSAENATASSIRLAQIDYELQNLQLTQLEEELAKQCIYAPAGGMVAYIAKQSIGEYIAARSLLIRLVDPNSLQVECMGDQVGDFQLGKEVVVKVDRESYAGKVVSTSANMPDLAIEKGQPFARIALTDPVPEDKALLGKGVTAELIRERKEDVLIVPRNVVSVYSGESYILILENGVKKERIIETGIKTTASVEVVSGLEEGETVIIK